MSRQKRSAKAMGVSKKAKGPKDITKPKAKISFKRSILPPLAGIFVMVAVVVLFNLQLIQAQWQYHKAQSQMIGTVTPVANNSAGTVDDTKSPNPERGPLLTIPSLGTEAPIIFEPSFAEWKVQVALRSGVVHYGTTANPGESGNVVILGHSSGQAWAPGDYKFVFTLLNKLQKDDVIYLDYNGTRYTYKVTDSVVVPPTDVSQIQPTTKPTLSLVTCTPVGTSLNRLVVHAEQVSPAPTTPQATDASNVASTQSEAAVAKPIPAVPQQLPGSAQESLWQRFLNLF